MNQEKKEFLKKNPRGLGDKIDTLLNDTPLKTVTAVAKKVLFPKGCDCEGRIKKLNDAFPNKLKPVREFTENEKERFFDVCFSWGNFTLDQIEIEIEFISLLYSEIFGKPYFQPSFRDTDCINIMMKRLGEARINEIKKNN